MNILLDNIEIMYRIACLLALLCCHLTYRKQSQFYRHINNDTVNNFPAVNTNTAGHFVHKFFMESEKSCRWSEVS